MDEMNLFDDDRFHDQCGVVAVVNHPQASERTYLGLYALQHRGQEGAGIAAMQPSGVLSVHKKRGLVSDIFEPKHFQKVPGPMAIGHVRYSTQGGNVAENLQPLTFQCKFGSIAVAHNGNFPHADESRRHMEQQGAIFQSSSDTELIAHLISHSSKKTLREAILEALSKVEAAYSLVFLTPEGVVAARDPYGFRPLVLGKEGKSHVIASETCAFDLMGIEFVRTLEAGEVLFLNEKGIESLFPFPKKPQKRCIFEWIYFSRPDSVEHGKSIHQARIALGETLAKEHPAASAQLVIPVPDSGVPAAIGYSRASGIPFEMGIIRNHYVHRTFIHPNQEARSSGVRIKLNPVEQVIRGKSIVVVDDSIVRGTTSQKLVRLLREAGAKEIHLRISSPPVTGPCFFGIDTPSKEELIASQHDLEGIRSFIGADSLAYLSHQGMLKAIGGSVYCDACFTGDYPTIQPPQIP